MPRVRPPTCLRFLAASWTVALAVCAVGCPSKTNEEGRSLPAASTGQPGPSAVPVRAAGGLSVSSAPNDEVSPGTWDGFTGGSYETCYAGFQPQGDAVKDVMRLGLLCGPYHGMREVRPGWVGDVSPEAPQAITIQATRGACYRVVGVDEEAAGPMKVQISGSDGAVVARSAPSRWVVLPARGLWCAESSGEYVARVSTTGSGRVALQVWLLP